MQAKPMTFTSYREVISRTLVPLVAAPLGDASFWAEVDGAGCGELQITTVRSTAQLVRRTSALIDDAASGYAMATIHVAGQCQVEQDGRSAQLTPGAIVFCDSTRPFDFSFGGSFEQVIVQAPRDAVPQRALKRASGLPLGGEDGRAAAVGAFFRALAGPDCSAFATHALGLISSTVAIAAGAQTAPAELERERVLLHLRQAFRDPGLDADAVAHSCHLSRRTLFRLFRDSPRSLADELRQIRVAEAQRLLRTHPGRSVADIAAASGFGGETQLRRAFRAVAGTTPGRYRSETIGSSTPKSSRP
ncbi:AraC family transcriptional regulator [Mycobacterium kubicae]|nr:AraC family transcriptional regulator [Mycobacterium kubicae]